MAEHKLPKELAWLKKNAVYLNIYLIEQETGTTEKTLRNFVDGKYNLREHWHKALIKWVRDFKK
jgi:hypothetical protein